MNISLNGVDFAILLGFLATGESAKSKLIYQTYDSLRFEQALRARAEVPRNGFIGSWCAAAASGISIIATGGLAAPVAGPLFLAGWASAFGFGAAGAVISESDRSAWNQKREVYRGLLVQFPHLEQLLSPTF